MFSVFRLLSSLHRAIGMLVTWANHVWHCVDHARDENGPHPDDMAELDAMMETDANTLRELAHDIEMRRIEIKRNVLQYQLAAAE